MAANRLPGKSCCFDGNRLMISTDTLQHSILCKLYLEAAHDLLVVYGLKTNLVPEPASATSLGNKPSHVSVLGATGDGIALSSVVKVDQDLLTRLYPLGSSADVAARVGRLVPGIKQSARWTNEEQTVSLWRHPQIGSPAAADWNRR